MTDEQLIDYCESHCRTKQALFTGTQIKRIAALAGRRIQPILDHGFYPCHELMAEMCVDASAVIVGRRVLESMGVRP